MERRERPELYQTEPAGDGCHACERDFESLFDFPIVRVAAFDRTVIPTDLVLPDAWEIFVDPEAKVGNRKVPAEIKALFDDENVVKGRRQDSESSVWRDTVNHDGWQWSRIKHGEDNVNSSYSKARILFGGGSHIASVVEPYLPQLEGFVHRLVRPDELKLSKIAINFTNGTQFTFPKACLEFDDNHLHQESTRKASLVVYTEHGMAPGGGTLLGKIAEIATLSYEGRIYK